MTRYDADRDPIAEEWLELDEQERIGFVTQYHRKQRIEMPNETLHAIVHVIVEN